jgi:hypothetical protein
MAVVIVLGLLSAFTAFKVESWILLAIAVIILVGAVAFGYLSLWEIPKIAARFRNIQLAVGRDRKATPPSRAGNAVEPGVAVFAETKQINVRVA